jgi:Concanavalin A-like lectin/glucanases superfamily
VTRFQPPIGGAGLILPAGVRAFQAGLTGGVDYNARWGVVSAWNLADTADAIGANTLTNNNGATFTAGKVGNAATLVRASAQYLSRASNAGLQTGAVDFWLGFWIKFASDPGINMYPFSKGTSPEYAGYYNSGEARFHFTIANFAKDLQAANSGAFTVGTWYFVLCWYDATNQTINVRVNNGGSIDTLSTFGTTITANASALTLGWFGAANTYVDGQMDAVVFGKSPPGGIAGVISEISSTLYNAGAGKEPPY